MDDEELEKMSSAELKERKVELECEVGDLDDDLNQVRWDLEDVVREIQGREKEASR